MLNLSFDEKKSISISHCKQMDIINFKIDCINYKFKNVKSKLSNYDSLSDVNHLDNLVPLSAEEHRKNGNYSKLHDIDDEIFQIYLKEHTFQNINGQIYSTTK